MDSGGNMNRYLAVCHAFALLENPINSLDFSLSAAHNPLFQGSCSEPHSWLEWLSQEDILKEQGDQYLLSTEGERLYRHILNWTARDKQAVAERSSTRRAVLGTPPIQPDCPACSSDFCADYLTAILLENFIADRSHWTAAETSLLQAAICLFQTEHPLARLYLLADVQLRESLPTGAFGLNEETLQQHYGLRLTLPRLRPELTQVPRIRFERGLLPKDNLQALQRLAFPALFAGESLSSQPESYLLRLSRPLFNAEQSQALIHLDAGSLRRWAKFNQSEHNWL